MPLFLHFYSPWCVICPRHAKLSRPWKSIRRKVWPHALRTAQYLCLSGKYAVVQRKQFRINTLMLGRNLWDLITRTLYIYVEERNSFYSKSAFIFTIVRLWFEPGIIKEIFFSNSLYFVYLQHVYTHTICKPYPWLKNYFSLITQEKVSHLAPPSLHPPCSPELVCLRQDNVAQYAGKRSQNRVSWGLLKHWYWNWGEIRVNFIDLL